MESDNVCEFQLTACAVRYAKCSDAQDKEGSAAIALHSLLMQPSVSVTISPVSVAALGLVSKTKGLSLRFPRFMKVREDKGIEDASTAEFLANMWTDQQGKEKDQGGADDGELIDVVEETDFEDSEAELDVG